MSVFGAVLDLLFPPKCPFCRRVVDGAAVCEACEKSLPWTKGEKGLFTGADGLCCAAPLFYEGAVRDALLRLKFHGQARLLAESACRLWKTPPERLLVKIGDNPAQSGLADAAARRANVLGMYELAPAARVAGRRILLIDDICTTGSTLTECVRTLRSGGAEQVVCAAVARTRPERDTQRAGEDKLENFSTLQNVLAIR